MSVDGWNAQDCDLEGRLWTMPAVNLNGERYVKVENVIVVMKNSAMTRHAYELEFMKKLERLKDAAKHTPEAAPNSSPQETR